MSVTNSNIHGLYPTFNIEQGRSDLADSTSVTKLAFSVIFLDIDGVFFINRCDGSVPKKAKELFPHLNENDSNWDHRFTSYHLNTAATYFFKPEAVSNLEALIKDVQNVAIVISSSWRQNNSVKQLQEIFQKYSFAKYIIDKTPDRIDDEDKKFRRDLRGKAREIAYYLSKHPEILSFVIFDDLDEGLSEEFPNNFVQIDRQKFLSEDDIKKAKRILTSTIPSAQQSNNDSCCELTDGQIFSWQNFATTSPQEMDRRIVQLSQNPPKVISHHQSVEDMINEMCLVSPLWSDVTISPERNAKVRAMIFFFEAVARHFDPMRLFLNKHGKFDRYTLSDKEAELMARQMKFFMLRVNNQKPKEFYEIPSPSEEFSSFSELDFDGFNLQFLPPEIGLFENLRTLKLAGNNLTELPDSIGNLEKLQSLDLSGNKLKQLPDTLNKCSALVYLNLAGNPLSHHPHFLQHIRNVVLE